MIIKKDKDDGDELEEFRPEDGAPPTAEEEAKSRREGKCQCDGWPHCGGPCTDHGCDEPVVGEWQEDSHITPLCIGCYAHAFGKNKPVPADKWTPYTDRD